MTPADRLAALALGELPRVGEVTYRELVERFGSPARAFAQVATAATRRAALSAVAALDAAARAAGAVLWSPVDAHYPAALRDLPDPPTRLFALGEPATLGGPVVAIVGTRDASGYGLRVTEQLAGALAAAGACVVSGLARGIDARAHQAALAAGGRTVAVLGTGIDVPYPAQHRALHGEIARRGLVLSELPPAATAQAGSFPRRNRIIAALAEVTIVVEAGVRSGALITADRALDLGRTVAAVPGPIDVERHAGTNLLIRDGALTIAGVDDALAALGLSRPRAPRAVAPDFDGDARTVWDALARGPLDADALTAHSGLPAARCLAAVTTLELAGAVDCALTGEISRR